MRKSQRQWREFGPGAQYSILAVWFVRVWWQISLKRDKNQESYNRARLLPHQLRQRRSQQREKLPWDRPQDEHRQVVRSSEGRECQLLSFLGLGGRKAVRKHFDCRLGLSAEEQTSPNVRKYAKAWPANPRDTGRKNQASPATKANPGHQSRRPSRQEHFESVKAYEITGEGFFSWVKKRDAWAYVTIQESRVYQKLTKE